MSETAVSRPRAPAVFTQGSLVRHVLVMTSTGSIGLVAVFMVDLLSLIYVSWLGEPALTAGVGFAAQVLFFIISVNIGLSIAVAAVVARAIGANDRPRAQQLAGSGLIHSFVIASVVGLLLFVFRRPALELLGARGAALEAAEVYLVWTLPTNGLMALGMVLSGLLRAVGDARRSMYVTLFGSIVTAVVDPFLILGLKMGVEGAAIAAVVSRFVWLAVGLWGAVHIHGIVGRPDRKSAVRDLPAIMKIALPAILTNLAAPVANGYAVRAMSTFGEAAVAAGAIIDRVVPVAFVVLFAMSGVVGPIVAQNHGAKLYPRVRSTLTTCFAFAAIYSLTVWLLLALNAQGIAWLFSATGETARLVIFFCDYGAVAWVFLGCLFAANAAFNNLDFAFLSTLFNWGRATLGTVPFVALGAHYLGSEGVILGVIVGGAVFGSAAMVTAYAVVGRIARTKA
jgi:putative MATE family efflux protein